MSFAVRMRAPCWGLTGHGNRGALLLGLLKWSCEMSEAINVWQLAFFLPVWYNSMTLRVAFSGEGQQEEMMNLRESFRAGPAWG